MLSSAARRGYPYSQTTMCFWYREGKVFRFTVNLALPLSGLRRFHYIYELAWTRQRKISAREMIHPSFRAEHLHTDRDVDQVSAMLIL